MTSKIAWGAVAPQPGAPHNPRMARTARPAPPERLPHFVKEWREEYGWSQTQLCERLDLLEPPYPLSEAQLSRIERGAQPYNQDLLEALAKVFETSVQNIVSGGPNAPHLPPALAQAWSRVRPGQEALALRLLETVTVTDEPDPEYQEVNHLGLSRAETPKERASRGIPTIRGAKPRKPAPAPSRRDEQDEH